MSRAFFVALDLNIMLKLLIQNSKDPLFEISIRFSSLFS